jgi:uncharacterized protein (DUF2236 family)
MAETMAGRPAGTSPDFDVRDVANGVGLLAATANVIMQLARPAVGYGVLESKVESSQVMRHPVRRWRTTVTYLSVALMGTPAEREIYRRAVNRSHAQVRSTPESPVSYNAFDSRLQLWVAACLYRGVSDVYTLLHGPVDERTAGAIYRASSRLGTTLQVPEDMWPRDRAAFERYWDTALGEIRIDPPVRAYLDGLTLLRYLPRPLSAAFGPVNRFLTTGFLPPPFRELMQLPWAESDQRRFEALIQVIATVNRLLPPSVRRFPFNACLQDLRVRIRRDFPPSRPALLPGSMPGAAKPMRRGRRNGRCRR